ncbi:hypothetical protein COT99_04355 [Candidatus Falkowbacteria bacterium CG10_big_fil_rev_8_21_14_0_10_43_10]|uniref:Uncharacterized protein n=1 Tax=Candidatus Falkowbacteria bacterium CG10_big_fil_rev_8_21_14_0_10_43_10 TaxID=1974567 RepID=A0A2H0V118_9BACT|nr:MAG: hypothetical protein COT99_04355 [Candidatus Falkowbacteria bacterium CG10_big_fil_rev_8_21_14_0_10_43_10]
MLSKRLIAILIIIFALIILIALIYFIFLAPVPEPEVVKEAETIAQQEPFTPGAVTAQPARQPRSEAVSENDLKRIAGSFIERYGSYSNQSGYTNIRDLEIFMSQPMQNWARDYVEQTKAKEAANEIYYGISTKAVVVETQQFSESGSKAEFIVKTQREESIGVGANVRGFQQDAAVYLVKEKGMWKVDRVVWVE